MLKPLKNLLALSALLAISACSAKIEIKNIPLYWDAGPDGAIQSFTESPITNQLTKAEWDALRPKTVAMLYEDFAWIRSTVEKFCSEKVLLCTKDVREKMGGYFNRIDRVARFRRHR